jgi:hypothetical protein
MVKEMPKKNGRNRADKKSVEKKGKWRKRPLTNRWLRQYRKNLCECIVKLRRFC